jgi:4-hydroxy-4-methyl-2-oxoglutarate aldolase
MPERDALDLIASYGGTAISDALDTLGIDGGCQGLRAITPGARCAGLAITIRFDVVQPGEAGPAADYIDEVPPGSVIMIDNGGRRHCTVWGDILSACARARGIAGTVIHGCCRDSARIRESGYPVFALSAYMKSGKNRVRMTARDVPVVIGSTTIRPRDIVVGDDDGVVVIPRERLADVVRVASEVVAMEQRVVAAVMSGMTLAEARRVNGYDRFSLRSSR